MLETMQTSGSAATCCHVVRLWGGMEMDASCQCLAGGTAHVGISIREKTYTSPFRDVRASGTRVARVAAITKARHREWRSNCVEVNVCLYLVAPLPLNPFAFGIISQTDTALLPNQSTAWLSGEQLNYMKHTHQQPMRSHEESHILSPRGLVLV
ncbi:hypothetical protein ZHAS_00004665 [Anopheles sinensis]|uniref:Uncharacterized protein n=1 Tax=Anopheles sinensis TaxID=74873 RepID=A0A084VHC5_ANOSI|nr:hypothetical protein ZHAS_00004665 [Anopheles sinensis]